MKIKELKEHLKKYESIYITIGFILWFLVLIVIAMALTKFKAPYRSYAIEIGNLQIAWYAVFIISGIVMGAILAFKEASKLAINTNHLSDAILIAVPLAIIGARLYYVIFDPDKNYQSFADVFNIRQGGLAIHGAIIITIIFIIIYTRLRKMNIWALMDIVAPGFLIGQVLGRWGNFFNREAHGGPIKENTYQTLKYIIPKFILENMYLTEDGITDYHHPTFLYEGLWNLAGLIIILIIRRKKLLKLGDIIGYYLIWYGLGRGLLIEPFRTDPLYIGSLRVNIVFSLVLFVGGGILFLILKTIFIKELPYYHDFVLENEMKIKKENS